MGTTDNRRTVMPRPSAEERLRWAASSGCLHATLRRIVGELAAAYGPVTVNSTCRSPSRKAAVGGARHSYHLSGSATDFRVHGNARVVRAYLSGHRSVGGLKHYGGGLFHMDVGLAGRGEIQRG